MAVARIIGRTACRNLIGVCGTAIIGQWKHSRIHRRKGKSAGVVGIQIRTDSNERPCSVKFTIRCSASPHDRILDFCRAGQLDRIGGLVVTYSRKIHNQIGQGIQVEAVTIVQRDRAVDDIYYSLAGIYPGSFHGSVAPEGALVDRQRFPRKGDPAAGRIPRILLLYIAYRLIGIKRTPADFNGNCRPGLGSGKVSGVEPSPLIGRVFGKRGIIDAGGHRLDKNPASPSGGLVGLEIAVVDL